MVSINYSAREVCCKIVYYGPGLSGKTTNLQYVHAKVPNNTRGKLISLATEADRTLYFDFLPINIGTINGFQAKFQLYTVPGQVYYNATRKLVLRGVDGIVFVADSQPDKMDENIESLINLEENLKEYGYDIDSIPMVIQYNKRDLPGVLPVEELNRRLNPKGRPWFEASATMGNGVFDTLKLIIKLVLEKAKQSGAGAAARKPVSATLTTGTAAAAAPAAGAASESAAAATPTPEPAQAAQPSAGTAVAAPPQPETSAPETPQRVRPFPGSQPSAEKKLSPSAFTSTRAEEETQPAAGATAESHTTADTPEPTPEVPSGPQMAPPLRRRTRKRGFFKRLFGIR